MYELEDRITSYNVCYTKLLRKFIERSYQRIAELKELIEKTHSKALIEVDGGVNLENAAPLFAAGADVLVAGTSVFHTSDPAYTIEQLLKA